MCGSLGVRGSDFGVGDLGIQSGLGCGGLGFTESRVRVQGFRV